MTTYIALLRKDPASDFGVDVPDFPGCVTASQTLQDASRMAIEALTLHVQGMQQDHGRRSSCGFFTHPIQCRQERQHFAFQTKC